MHSQIGRSRLRLESTVKLIPKREAASWTEFKCGGYQSMAITPIFYSNPAPNTLQTFFPNETEYKNFPGNSRKKNHAISAAIF